MRRACVGMSVFFLHSRVSLGKRPCWVTAGIGEDTLAAGSRALGDKQHVDGAGPLVVPRKGTESSRGGCKCRARGLTLPGCSGGNVTGLLVSLRSSV